MPLKTSKDLRTFEPMQEDSGIRINKYLSEMGVCSRREADKLLEQGRITVDGQKPEMGTKVAANSKIKIDGKPIRKREQRHVYLAFNKPIGIVCTTDTKREKDNIVDFIDHTQRIFPIGRLDKPSEGLIFLTSDGDIVNKILRAGNKHEKEYVVTVDRPITPAFLAKMSSGVPILGQVTKKCKVERVSKFVFRIVLVQGLNRQIRRMCEYLGYNVIKLKRVRIMHVKLDIPVGKHRSLTKSELNILFDLIKDSEGTFQPQKANTGQPTGKSKGANTSASHGKNSAKKKPLTKRFKSPISKARRRKKR
jgi:23S rRNA pseudouridine2604 synthase